MMASNPDDIKQHALKPTIHSFVISDHPIGKDINK
jgi:hypothetical protein